MNQLDFDRQIMQRCLQLAQQGLGQTSPNPLVGSVIVQNWKIVGEGFHPKAGASHAEIFALQNAQEKAKEATVYVNLEPCNHYGRTPPCTEALIKAGVKKVVIGMVDPNPLVSGKGVEKLKQSGIEVVIGVEEAACRQLNEAFIHRVLYQKPLGILKYAMTLDGKIAATTGHSTWVTGKSSRRLVHQVRAACDAVVVGGNTVRQDNPNLTTHKVGGSNPLRVVMSRSLDLPLQANLWQTDIAPTLVFTEINSNSMFQEKLSHQGIEVIELTSLTPLEVMKVLYEKEISSVLWECGETLAAHAIADGVIQKIMVFIAPKIIGGLTAPSPIGELGLKQMTEALEIQRITLSQIDQDILVEGYLSIFNR
jgi:diaminohydroxyphosphoribosylaminopyrimidine deaminase / 5-amino-6-(5-phosphoribosylamino)uracil reductase